MKFFRIILLLYSLDLAACDLCGSFMGITPYDNQSQLMFLHRYRIFNGYRNYQQTSRFIMPGAYKTSHNPSGMAGDSITQVQKHSSKDYESYKVIELRGKYFLHQSLELNFILPFQQIKTKFDGRKNSNAGLSDPSLFIGYHVIKRLNGYTIRQRLILGGGTKFPLGIYDKHINEQNRLFLLNQNGSGSFDHFYYVNYLIGKKWWGANANCMLKFNGKNRYNERYANSYNQTLNLFTKFEIKELTIFPAIFVSYEYSKGLFTNGSLLDATNVNVLMLGPSVDLSYKKFVLNASFQFNAYERVSSHSLSNAGRFVVGLTYTFNQSKYLIN